MPQGRSTTPSNSSSSLTPGSSGYKVGGGEGGGVPQDHDDHLPVLHSTGLRSKVVNWGSSVVFRLGSSRLDAIGFVGWAKRTGVDLAVAAAAEAETEAALGAEIHWGVWVGTAMLLVLLLLFALLVWYWGRILGKTVEGAIETYDQSVLGVDVNIEDLRLNPCTGVMEVTDMVINNPEGYKSEYLLKAGKVLLDLNMCKLACSCGKKVVVDKLIFKDVDVIYEKAWTTSNVNQIIDHLHAQGASPDGKGDPPVKEEPKKEGAEGDKKDDDTSKPADDKAAPAANPDSGSGREVILHEVVVEDVGLKVSANMMMGMGVRISVGDMHYHDFAKQVGNSMVDDIVQILLISILKTVLANIIGKNLSDKIA